MSAKKLYLLDAYALIYRAHFALMRNPLYNSRGLNTSAARGFTNLVYGLIKNEKPTHMAAAFDVHAPTNRAIEFDFYKANREAMPEDIRMAIPFIRRILEGFGIPILEVAGYEADDVVGTIAKKAEQDGFQVYMVTSDKDYGQLVSENIFMHKPAHLKKPQQILGVPEILAEWDIARVEQVIDMLGLMGDAVDNIPGIKGVGKKTAAKLLKKFGSIEELIANVHQLKGSVQKKVEAGKQNAIISKKLATIILDTPIDYLPDAYKLETPDAAALGTVFSELEFHTMGKRILGENYQANQADVQTAAPSQSTSGGQLDLFNTVNKNLLPNNNATSGKNIDNTEHDYQLADTPEKQAALLELLLQQKVVCFDTETTSIDANNADLVGLSFAYEAHKAWYVPVPADQKEAQIVVERFNPFWENEEIAKVAQNIKYDMLVLKWYGITIKGTLEDTMLAHYLIAPDMRHNMTALSETYLNYSPVPIETLIGKKGKKQRNMRQVAVDKVAKYAAEDADVTLQLHEKFKESVDGSYFEKLYRDIEVPLVHVLTELEYNGINLDARFLKDYSRTLGEDLVKIQESIFSTVGERFNLNSPSQLGTILFDKMQIPYKGKKTKTGKYSTNEQKLLDLAAEHTIVNEILRYRSLNKLKSTYVDALPKLINPKTQRIHTTFNQAVASTGRLSSNNPNLQNIPIRSDEGKEVRKAFIPRSDDFILLAADYSQVELRLMAALSKDKNMIDAFQSGLDIHSATAARVYGVELDKVDSDMRRKAKMVNFGIIYGISAFGLAQRLGVRRTEAKEIIDEYFNQYQGIKNYMEESVELAKKTGYCETILGRRRYLKDIHSKNRTVRQFAERNAINNPIQGSAADIIKVAMINIHAEMQKRQMKSKMLLQVHDELVFDAHKSELEELTVMVKDLMSSAVSLDVPLSVEAGTGNNWLEAH